jgi:hypothetical protein
MIRNAPVRVRMGPARIEGIEGPIEVFVTVFDYGVFSFCFQVPVPTPCAWSAWLVKAEALGTERPLGDRLEAVARQRSAELGVILAGALKAPAERRIFEDYVIHFLQKVEGIERGLDLLAAADVPSLILAETKEKLSAQIREELQGGAVQYGETDLAVIDWYSAVLLEPSGVRDTADVLEFALTHLLEFRYYDALLDEKLGALYDAIERRRARPFPWRMVWRGEFADLSREANTRYLEFSELIERIENSLKVVGDSYLAVVFRVAIKRFRLLDWKESVSRKLGAFAKVSELIQGEINVYRGHTLELIVIALIAFEILQALLGRH